MRVNYTFHDRQYGDFAIEAEVSGSGRVHVLTIEDDHGQDIDFDDFTENEKLLIVELAQGARDDLNAMPDPDEPDEDEDE